MSNKIVTVESEAKIPASALRALSAVADARAYAAKPATSNLSDFRNFAVSVFGPTLEETVAAEFPKLSTADRAKIVSLVAATAPVIAGTYSRYQDAKRLGYLGEILSPTTYRVGRKPAAPKSKVAKPAAPKPGPKPAAPVASA